MKLSTRISRGFAHTFWNVLPANLQKEASKVWSVFYRTPTSAKIIKPFCRRYRMSEQEFNRYRPVSGRKEYSSFQDFFTRRLSSDLKPESSMVWPVQGYICDYGRLGDLDSIEVKGQTCTPRGIFKNADRLTNDHFFVNIFLHNHNYHRFHAPVGGRVRKIAFQSGELTFLRPWLYPRARVSEPALRNERVVIELEDLLGQSWFLCFVAGMGVGGLQVDDKVIVGSEVLCGQEIGVFLIGSTCCMAVPKSVNGLRYMMPVEVGSAISAD